MLELFFNILITISSFIVVIGVLVFIHEFGHFIVAKLCGVGVDVFSLGFGPKMVKRTHGGTEYCISAIPLGGYVKMVGEEAGNEIDPKDISRSFTHKSLWKKSLIVAAGPFFNFFLAILIFYTINQMMGIYLPKPIVHEVKKGTPAAEHGIKAGDVIKLINQKPIESFLDIPEIVKQSGDQPIEIVLEREGEAISVVLTTVMAPSKNLFNEDVQKRVIGILGVNDSFHKSLNPLQAFGYALSDTYKMVELTVLAVVKMMTGAVSAKNLGGPLMIAKMAGEQAKAGIPNFAWFIALVSVNLGIINLFPIPVLDGGHLMFFAIEAITRRPVGEKLRENLMKFGVAMLVTLMLFVIYNDIMNMVNKGG